MSGLFGGGGGSATYAEKLAGVQLQTSTYGGGIAIVYGTNRVPGNVVWYDDFKAIPHTETQSVGKGGGSNVTNTTYTYRCSVIMALCEGPIVGINRVWKDKEIGSLAKYGFSLFKGERSQSAWSWLATRHASKALGYGGTAYVAASALDLGDDARLGNHSFEVNGLFITRGLDAHPMDVIADLLVNQHYGAAWDSDRLGDFTDYWRYCVAAGLFMSPVIDEQKSLKEWLELLLKATNTCPVWSGGVLKLVPYCDTPVSGNGTTFTPNTTPVYDLDAHDFIIVGDEDPIRVTRTSQQDTFNCVPIEFRDRTTDYNTSVVEDPDPVDVEAFGLRKAQTETLHMITSKEVALQISRILAQRQVYCRNRYEFRLPWRYILLEPMDLVTLTEPKLGLDHKVVRILSIEEAGSEDDDGLRVIAEEWPFGVASATLYETGSNDGTVPNVNADPGDAMAPVIFEGPLLLTDWSYEMWIATAGGDLWGGCDVYVSDDNGASYTFLGRAENPATHGALTSELMSDGTSLTVSLAYGTLKSFTEQQRNDLVSLCWVNGELMSYETATLVSPGVYTLGNLKRAAYGTAAASHEIGSKFVLVNDAVLRVPTQLSRFGQSHLVKLVSYNVYGGGYQDISKLAPYSYTPSDIKIKPPYPATVTIDATTDPPSNQPGRQWRKIEDDATGAGYNDQNYPSLRNPRYVTVDWTPVSIDPASLLTGYRIVFFTGSDPNDVTTYVLAPKVVAASVTSITQRVNTPAESKTINAAVQALYGTNESSWRTSSGSVVMDPDTYPLASSNVWGSYGIEDAADVLWYRGNVDPAVRSGCPNVACATLTKIQWSSTLKLAQLDLALTPTQNSDNLDALRYAKVEWFKQSAAGTSNQTLTSLGTQYVPLPDRLYYDPADPDAAGNVTHLSIVWQNAGIDGGVPACKLTLHNVHGPSATHCFYTPSAGDVLTDNGTSWPAGLTGATGGSDAPPDIDPEDRPPGGSCPAPWIPIRLLNGRVVTAGRIQRGDLVWTQHEDTGEWGIYPVTYVSHGEAARSWLELTDGRRLLFSFNHRVLTDRGWVELCNLVSGDRLRGSIPGVVNRVIPNGRGPVVYIAIEGAHTYETHGIISHNIKKDPDQMQ